MLHVGILLAPKDAALVSNRLPLLEGGGRCPMLALPRGTDTLHFRVQLIDFLEGQTLGFIDEEVDKSDTDEAAAKPNEEYL